MAQTARTLTQALTKRQRYNLLRAQLENERSSFVADWRDIAEYLLPRRPRFLVTDVNRGNRRNKRILDGTGAYSVRTLRAGMVGGITSPARPWFELTTEDPDLAKRPAVKSWLGTVTDLMRAYLLRSNFYTEVPIVYGDLGVFGTNATLMEEDFEDVVRFYPYPVGSFCIANDARMQVGVFQRTFRYSVRQLVEKFGRKNERTGAADWSNFSTHVRDLWDHGLYETWIDVYHFITPNDEYSPKRLGAQYKRFASCYYEAGTSSATQQNYMQSDSPEVFLRESGYDDFPVLAPRWERNAEDVYGTSCPGVDAISDVKELQVMKKHKAMAIEKMVKPALVGPSSLRNQAVTMLPGGITYVDEREGMKGLRPLHEVNPPVNELREDINDIRGLVRHAFFEDLFLEIAESERRDVTATEIVERKQERLLALGPVLEQLNQDFLDPMIDRMFKIMLRQRRLPPPPQELQGQALKVKYTSIMAEAQKLAGAQSIERFSQFALNIASQTQDPSKLNKVDFDELLDTYGETLSVPAGIIRSDEEADALTQAQQRQAQAAQRMQAIQQGAGALKDLSGADTSGDNALTQLLDQSKAGQIAPVAQ